MRRTVPAILALLTLSLMAGVASTASGAAAVERFPAPEFRSGYQLPQTDTAPPRAQWRAVLDVSALTVALAAAAWLALWKRSRRGVFVLALASLAYFGFYRKGCICPIGATQNVAYAAGGHGYALPWVVAAFFALPLLFSLFVGRVFCAGVCPLGAVQDVVLWRPVRVPAWLEEGIGLFAWIYLGVAVLFAFVGSDFIVCRYDPFVGFFRLSGPAHMLFFGGVLLAIGLFVGRPYCRFMCPYGVVLRVLSRFAKYRVSITPSECVDCRLCEQACPFGAIRHPVPRSAAREKPARARRVAVALAALPLLVAGFALLGRLSGPALSRWDATVQLAERVWQEENGRVAGTTDASKAFRATGAGVPQLYETASALRRRFNTGGALLGGWVGLVIGAKLLGLATRRSQSGYTADPGACVSCARCYGSCPVELERRQQPRMVELAAKEPAQTAKEQDLVTV
jgi:ferredoxin